MKFGQFMSYYKRKNFIKQFRKNCDLKTSSKPFCVCKELIAEPLLENEIFEESYFFQICNSRTITIYPNQHAYFLRFLFTENSLKIAKSPELVSRSNFSYIFYKIFSLVILHKLAKFRYQTVFTSQVFSKTCFVLHA